MPRRRLKAWRTKKENRWQTSWLDLSEDVLWRDEEKEERRSAEAEGGNGSARGARYAHYYEVKFVAFITPITTPLSIAGP